MRDKVFIDTNVLIYSFDNKNPQKQTIAKKLLKTFFDKDEYFISSQVLNEFCSAALKKLTPPLEIEVLREFVSAFPARKILPVNREITLSALVIMEKYKFSYWDCMVAATALNNECAVLYSEDLHDGLVIENVLSIAHPFK